MGWEGSGIRDLVTVATSRNRGWEGIVVDEVVHQVDDFALAADPAHLLVLHLDRPLEVAERRRGRTGLLREGSLTILPAGAPTDWHLERQGDIRHLHLHLDPSLLARVAAEVGLNAQRVELAPRLGVRSAEVEQIGLALLRELRSGGLGGRILADSLATLLAVQLLREHTAHPQRAAPARDALTGAPLKRVTEYIEEHLADDLSLAAVAAVANISPYHFTRLFRTATGLAPHQYIIQRRVDRARLLLTATEWTLTAIAREVGFANGSHLALHFKRRMGLTPRAYRAFR